MEEDRTLEEIVAEGFDRADVERVMTLVTLAEYKRRQAAPGLKITPRAFGKDRRFPIANASRLLRGRVPGLAMASPGRYLLSPDRAPAPPLLGGLVTAPRARRRRLFFFFGITVLIVGALASANWCDCTEPCWDLEIQVTADHDSLEPGARITYTITFEESGYDGQGYSLHVIPPPETTFTPVGAELAGAQEEILVPPSAADWAQEGDGVWIRDASFLPEDLRLTLVVTVNDVLSVVLDPEATELLLAARLVGDDDGPLGDKRRGNDVARLAIPVVDLGLSSERTEPAPGTNIAPGDTLAYGHTLTNTSPWRAMTTLTNVVPAGTTYVALGSDSRWTCADGASAGTECTRPVTLPPWTGGLAQTPLTIPFVVRINDDHPLDTPIVNDASLPNVSSVEVRDPEDDDLTVAGLAGDPNPATNRTSLETSLSGPEPEFSVTKTASLVGLGVAGLGAAGSITYTVVVENTGSVDLTSVTLLDQLVTFGPAVQTGAGDPTNTVFEVGETWTFTATYLVTAAVFTANGVDALGQPDGDGDIDSTTTVLAVGPTGPLPPVPLSLPVPVEQWAIPGANPVSGDPAGAVGPPDTVGCGDFPATAWEATFDGPGAQILEVDFAPTNFHATGIEIYVTNETGFIILIELLDENGAGVPANQVYWSTADTGPHLADTTGCPGVFRWTFPQTPFEVTSAWIYTDSPGPEQIDAVRLIGVTVTP